MTSIDVRCEGSDADGWSCLVSLRDQDRDISSHRVRVGSADLQRLFPDSDDPVVLVEESFRFLLERESPQSILRSFDLMEIARYFPAYEGAIRAAYHRRRV